MIACALLIDFYTPPVDIETLQLDELVNKFKPVIAFILEYNAPNDFHILVNSNYMNAVYLIYIHSIGEYNVLTL